MNCRFIALTSSVSACVGHSTAYVEVQVGSGEGQVVTGAESGSVSARNKVLKLLVRLGSVFGRSARFLFYIGNVVTFNGRLIVPRLDDTGAAAPAG